MLSQLVSARRVKIGDPAVLARLLAARPALRARPGATGRVPALLEHVLRRSCGGRRPRWPGPCGPRVPAPAPVPAPAAPARPAADALRGVAEPARLAAAAAALATAFPELAEVLRQAASRPACGSQAHAAVRRALAARGRARGAARRRRRDRRPARLAPACPRTWHVTLAFHGEADPGGWPAGSTRRAGTPAPRLRLAGTGCSTGCAGPGWSRRPGRAGRARGAARAATGSFRT